MQKTQIIIGDTSASFGEVYLQLLSAYDVSVKLMQSDSDSLVQTIIAEQPEVVVLIAYTKTYRAEDIITKIRQTLKIHQPKFIVSYKDDRVFKKLLQIGANQCLHEPYDYQEFIRAVFSGLSDKICPLRKALPCCQKEINLSQLQNQFLLSVLDELEIKKDIGRACLEHAITRLLNLNKNQKFKLNDINLENKIKWNLSSLNAVEKAMTRTIQYAFDNGTTKVWMTYFGSISKNGEVRGPSNKKFILRIAEVIKEKVKKELDAYWKKDI